MIAVLLLFPLHLVGAQTAQDASELVRYDLKAVLPRFDSTAGWEQSLVQAPNSWVETPSAQVHGLYEDAAPDVVLDLVTQVLGDELRYEGRQVALENETTLIVLAPAAVQAQVRHLLDTLDRALSVSVTLRVDVVTLDEAGGEPIDQNLVSPAEAERLVGSLVARGAAHREHVFALSPGRTFAIDQTATIPFVYDFDVEIAQSAFVWDPVVIDVDEGMRLLVRGVPRAGGIELSVVFRDVSVRGGIRDKEIRLRGLLSDEQKGGVSYGEGPSKLQTADLLTRAVAFESFLPEGQALIVASDTQLASHQSRQLLVLRRSGEAAAPLVAETIPGTSRTVMLLNMEMFRGPELRITGKPQLHERLKGHPFVVASLSAEPSPFLFDWLKYRFSVWRMLGPWAIIVTDPAWDDRAGDELEALVSGVGTPPEVVQLEVRMSSSGAGAANPVTVTLPCLEGSSAGIVVGMSGTAVRDYDVEVAQFAAVVDPTVVASFSGLALEIGVSAAKSSYVLETRGTVQQLRRPIRAFDAGGPILGPIERVEYDTLSVEERHSVARGKGASGRITIGARSTRSEQSSLGLTVRVRGPGS